MLEAIFCRYVTDYGTGKYGYIKVKCFNSVTIFKDDDHDEEVVSVQDVLPPSTNQVHKLGRTNRRQKLNESIFTPESRLSQYKVDIYVPKEKFH